MLSAEHIKAAAAEAGFDLCGIARARHLDERERTFRRWLGAGRHSTLSYMERNAEKRFDASLLVEGARTVIVCGVSYKSALSEGYPAECRTKIASYAACDDYHVVVIKDMLRDLSGRLRRRYPDLSGRAFVDTAPLSEKSYAVEAGLGWVGRQSLLVTPGFGSFVLLGELVVTDEADSYDAPFGGEGAAAAAHASRPVPAAPYSITGRSTHRAAYRATRSSARLSAASISTAGYSAATHARAAVRTIVVHRCMPTRASTCASILGA